MPLYDNNEKAVIRLEIENSKLKTALSFACMELAEMNCPIENHPEKAERSINCSEFCVGTDNKYEKCWEKYFMHIAEGIFKVSQEATGGA